MRNLIAFLIKNSHWFLFLLLEIVCFFFIFKYNPYQRSIFFNSSNEIIGRVYLISGNVSSFFHLKKNNEDLLLQNVNLQQRILDLENYIHTVQSDSLTTKAFNSDSIFTDNNDYIIAKVVNNSVTQVENFIVINKGSNHGVKSEMGVVSGSGIVGFIRSVSPNFSLIQSVLNPKTQLNCKVKHSNTPTTLVWDASDYRYAALKDFPRYEKFETGDTIITSGVSKFFPEGFIVGTIEEYKAQKDDNFYTLRVKLATDFSSLSNVLVINNYTQQEIANLKEEVGYE